MFQPITDGIGDDRISDHLSPVIEWQLGDEHHGLASGSLLEGFAQILRFGGRELRISPLIQPDMGACSGAG